MDKDNKYYGLIEDLVKKHKKYPGHEAILDDIIEDVYSHAEIIIKSIDNESVIKSYLEKTISTSIITVPKKLNFHRDIPHKVIDTTPVINSVIPTVQNNEVMPQNIQEQKASSDLVDKMINSSFEDIVVTRDNNDTLNIDDSELEALTVEETTADYVNDNENDDNGIDESEYINEPNVVDDEADFVSDRNEDSFTDFVTEDITENKAAAAEEEELTEILDDYAKDSGNADDSDATDIENSISDVVEENIVSNNEIGAETIDYIEDDTPNIIEQGEIIEQNANILELSNDEFEEEKDLDIQSDTEILEFSESSESDESEVIMPFDDNAQTIDIIEENETEPEFEPEITEVDNFVSDEPEILELSDDNEDALSLSVNDDLTGLDDFNLSNEVNSNETLTEDTLLVPDENDNLSLDLHEDIPVDNLSEVNDSEFLLQSDNDIDTLDEVNVKDEEEPTKEISFRYVPQSAADYFDTDSIVNDILAINKKYPGLQILKVYDLKYKQKYKIDQIVNELNMNKSDVISALNKLSALI